MDMYETSEEEAFDTISLSDLQIYTDRSSSSEGDQDHESSFSSFRFKIVDPTPPKEIVFYGKLIHAHENDLKKFSKSQKSRHKTFPVQENDIGSADPLDQKLANLAPVLRQRRRSWKKNLWFGIGGSPTRMEMSDLRSRQTRLSPPRCGLVNGIGVEETIVPRRSGNWSKRMFGSCINPTVHTL
ncbi:hypothetical protein CTI12_AA029640 [Artemisia annua]|uniref:Uncharacterized protein n=1 Tax=Artemisia annua TaxID=35608 RepID=A0A2U1QDD0_ARTAN|nr:hypothetical protein CTI12_AA029640 [Artemisia annua]